MGTWSIPTTEVEVRRAQAGIDALEAFKTMIYSTVGDDILFDCLDGAINRMSKLTYEDRARDEIKKHGVTLDHGEKDDDRPRKGKTELEPEEDEDEVFEDEADSIYNCECLEAYQAGLKDGVKLRRTKTRKKKKE